MFRVFNTEQFVAADGTPFQVPDGASGRTPTLAEWLSYMLTSWMNGPGAGKFNEVTSHRCQKAFVVFSLVKPGELIELEEDHAKWLRDLLFVEAANYDVRSPSGEVINRVSGPWGYNSYGPLVGLAVRDAFVTQE